MTAQPADQIAAFERNRLALFKTHGFEAETHWFSDTTGHRTAAVVGGKGRRTIVLVHGMMMQAGEWALIAGKLDARVVIPDWPGYGLSEPSKNRRLDPQTLGTKWLLNVVEPLGKGPIDVAGSSIGGYLGLALALAYPDRVRRLVTVGSYPGLSRATPLIIRLFAAPIVGRFLLSQQPKDAEANRKEVFSHLSAHPERIPIDALENDLAAGALPNSTDTTVRMWQSLVNPLSGYRRHLLIKDAISKLSVPTLCLWGTMDNFLLPSRARKTLGNSASADIRELNGAGHLLTLEDPATVSAAINEFLAGS